MVRSSDKDRMKAKPRSAAYSNSLDRSISNVVKQHMGKHVSAFMLMSLDEDGDVAIHSSEHVKSWTDSIFPLNASDQLRHAHKMTSTAAKAVGVDKDRDLTCPSNFKHNQQAFRGGLPIVESTSQQSKQYAGRHVDGMNRGEIRPIDTQSGDEDDERDATSSDHEEEPEQADDNSTQEPAAPMIGITIGYEFEVEDFLRARLKRMQQLAVKMLAKAWIKGICPKKQGTFPYRNKMKIVPAWWPPTSVCPFREPDHIKRSERLALCLHLLRLRPTPGQLQEWNNGVEPHPTHATQGWVQFLMEIGPPALMDKIFGENKEKTETRKKLLGVAYDLALQEQRYKDGECDDTDVFYFPDHEDKPKVVRKSRLDTSESDSESEPEASGESAPRPKRRRLNPKTTATSTAASDVGPTELSRVESMLTGTNAMRLDKDAKADVHMTDATAKYWAEQASKDMQRCHSNFVDNKQSMPMPQQWQPFDMTYGGSANPWTTQGFTAAQGWPEAASATSSFEMQEPFTLGVPGNNFPNKPDYCFPQASSALQQPLGQHVYPVHMMTSLSHPHFDTVPNTPLMPVSHLLSLESEQAHPAQSAYRPNGHGGHGLPTYGSHASQSLSMPSSRSAQTPQQGYAFEQQAALPLRPSTGADSRLDFSPYSQRHSHAGLGHAHSHPEHQQVSNFDATGRFDRGVSAYGHGAQYLRY